MADPASSYTVEVMAEGEQIKFHDLLYCGFPQYSSVIWRQTI